MKDIYEKDRLKPNFMKLHPNAFIDSEVLKLVVHEDYKMSLWFKGRDRECLFDFKPLIDKYPFLAPLQDKALFAQAEVRWGEVWWRDDLNIDSVWLYLDAEPIED